MKWCAAVLVLLMLSLLSAGLVVPLPDGGSVELYSDYYALIIGNSDYQYFPKLKGVKKDVQDIKAMFEGMGIPTLVKENLNARQMSETLNRFIDEQGSKPNRGLILYYAGHGYTEKLYNDDTLGYIIPIDAPLYGKDRSGFRQSSISMNQIRDYAKLIQSKHVLMIFDSCFSGSIFRSNPGLPRAIDDKISYPVRQFITAGDADEEVPDQSLFKATLLKGLGDGFADMNADGYITGEELGYYLSSEVTNYSNNAQHPRYGKIKEPDFDRGDFVFAVKAAIIKDNTVINVPNNMVLVEGGTFMMGSNDSDREKPVHQVTVSSFLIGKYEVTQKEWKDLMGNNPSGFRGDGLPVESVSWYDMVEYCNIRSVKEGLTPVYMIDKNSKDQNYSNEYDAYIWLVECNWNANGYRLPTEAEWEFAARGGNKSKGYKYSGFNDIGSVGWFRDNSNNTPHPKGIKTPNELGIYDMSGNVYEFCWDWFGSYVSASQNNPTGAASGSYRVLRGGCWDDDGNDCRVSCRCGDFLDGGDSMSGFRLCRSIK